MHVLQGTRPGSRQAWEAGEVWRPTLLESLAAFSPFFALVEHHGEVVPQFLDASLAILCSIHCRFERTNSRRAVPHDLSAPLKCLCFQLSQRNNLKACVTMCRQFACDGTRQPESRPLIPWWEILACVRRSGGPAGLRRGAGLATHLVNQTHGQRLLGRVQTRKKPHLPRPLLPYEADRLRAAVPSIEGPHLGACLPKDAVVCGYLHSVTPWSHSPSQTLNIAVHSGTPRTLHDAFACAANQCQCRDFCALSGLNSCTQCTPSLCTWCKVHVSAPDDHDLVNTAIANARQQSITPACRWNSALHQQEITLYTRVLCYSHEEVEGREDAGAAP